MTISKPFMTITTLAVAALFGGGVYVMMNLGSLAERVTERLASRALGVAVEIQAMEVSLQERKAVVNGLNIANPPGFKNRNALTVDTISVELGNVSRELVVFKDITVQGTDIYMEVHEDTTNFQTIQPEVKSPPPQTAQGEEAEHQPLKVIIERLDIAQAKLNPSVTLAGGPELAPVVMPDIVMTGIGRKENGVLVQEAIVQVWQNMSRKMNSTAAGAGFYEGMNVEVLKEMGVTQFQKIRDQVSDGVNNIGKSIKGLFE